MPNLYHDNFFPRVEGVGSLSTDFLEEAFILNGDEQYWLFREYHELNNRMDTPEARRIFNSDHTANTLMLCLKREVLSKINQLVDNWNVYIDLTEIDMSMKITRGEMTTEQASQKREINESHANRLRNLYVWAKREWARELRSYVIIFTWQRAILNTTVGII
ncbi:hypothetical protein KCU65_g6239, partial [Aureobasidium melanogenum]